jgi:hypothetical protein
LSGFSAKQRSSRSMKWLSSLVSASFMPLDAARRRVRRSRVGLTMGKVLTAVCTVYHVSTGTLTRKDEMCYFLKLSGGCDEGKGKGLSTET